MTDDPREIPRALREPSYLVRAVRAPIQTFIHTEEIGAMVLLAAAAAAVGWANSPWSDSYFDFWHTYISFDIHIFAISENLGHLVNEGLMAVFFFVVGLEIKRELLHGELSSFRKAAVPVFAAIGGYGRSRAYLPRVQQVGRRRRRLGRPHGHRHRVCPRRARATRAKAPGGAEGLSSRPRGGR